jgi:hypothetical protein
LPGSRWWAGDVMSGLPSAMPISVIPYLIRVAQQMKASLFS